MLKTQEGIPDEQRWTSVEISMGAVGATQAGGRDAHDAWELRRSVTSEIAPLMRCLSACLPVWHQRRGRRKICCGRTADAVVVESSGEAAVEAAWLSRTREISVSAVKVVSILTRRTTARELGLPLLFTFPSFCLRFCFACQVARSWRCWR